MAPKKQATEAVPKVPHPRFRRPTPELWIAALICLALLARLAWMAYTRYTAEDAFITFRFARQLAAGHGFVYNLGERIEGTTTPLFTLMLAGWSRLSADIVLGARLLDLTAATGAIILTWLTLRRLGQSTAGQAGAILLIGFSSKLWLMDTQGMETPLVLLLMVAAWYALARQRPAWAGGLAGLLLWTRLDLLLWPVLLVFVAGLSDLKSAFRLALAAVLTYLPWVVFARLYFGSPIPYSITAKYVAYFQFDHTPLLDHLSAVIKYLSPFDVGAQTWLNWLLVGLTLALAGYQAVWRRGERLLLAPVFFVPLEIARLVLTRATFTSRYFIPVLWAVLLLAGLGAGQPWDRIMKMKPVVRWTCGALAALVMLAGIGYGLGRADEIRDIQTYRNEGALMAVGVWLHDHTSSGTTVELEPLGYIGYYADRTMLDDVGLVTPAVVDLKRRQVPDGPYFTYLHPDDLVLHCDDALEMQGQLGGAGTGLSGGYSRVAQFNPLNFDPFHPGIPGDDTSDLMRSACFEIWQMK